VFWVAFPLRRLNEAAHPYCDVRFEESRAFSGDPEALWGRVSDIPRMPEFWHGTKELKVIAVDNGRTKARVRFAFGGSGTVEIEVQETSKRLLVHYVSGPFTGLQEVDVQEGKIKVVWEIKFGGVYRIASGWNEGHFKEGSRHALERLCDGLPPTKQIEPSQGQARS
jgi:ribosome-associated toxin RatA of RatAB toxin-antitoxin module